MIVVQIETTALVSDIQSANIYSLTLSTLNVKENVSRNMQDKKYLFPIFLTVSVIASISSSSTTIFSVYSVTLTWLVDNVIFLNFFGSNDLSELSIKST